MKFHRVGQPIRLFATLIDSGQPTNASQLRLVITSPSGASDEYIYGDDPEIVRPNTGQYYFDFVAGSPGDWSFAWYAEGSPSAFKSGTIQIAWTLTLSAIGFDSPLGIPFTEFKMWASNGDTIELDQTTSDENGNLEAFVVPGAYRVRATKNGWFFDQAIQVDLVGDGPYSVEIKGRPIATRWLTWEDLEGSLDVGMIDQLFTDQLTGVRNPQLIEDVMLQAEALAESKLLRNWALDDIYKIARVDRAIRMNAAWIAIELATERKSEFVASDGKGRFWAQYERAIAYFEALAKSQDRSRGETDPGPNGANVGGSSRPIVRQPKEPFFFAPGRNGRLPGGF